MMGREVWVAEPVGVGGRIGRVCLGWKGEQKGGRDPLGERERELRSLNRILKEKLHCIHHNEPNSTNSHGGGK